MDDLRIAVSVDDYHDFAVMTDAFRGLDKTVKFWEGPFGDNDNYWGVIYTGVKNEAKFKQLCRDGGFVPHDDEKTQLQLILQYMEEWGNIDPEGAFMDYNISCLSARICELRKLGHDIETQHDGKQSVYCLL